MRKCGMFFLAVLATAAIGMAMGGCSDKKPPQDSTAADTTAVADTISSEDSVIAEQPMPKAADELFDDFFFNFAANRRLQLRRIVFPLPVFHNGKLVRHIPQKGWRMEHFFMRQDYYTLLFDNEKQMNLVKDTSVAHVTVEKIFLKDKAVEQYQFDRIHGQFMLTGINHKPMFQNRNASFWKFYERFATDSAFQVESMNDEVTFTSPNPDDDFENQTGVILPEQWPYFKPAIIPTGILYNIIYGQTYRESTKKVFVIRGIANDLEIEMTFRRKEDGQWKLMQFNS